MNKLIRSRQIYWCHGDDRYVLVIKDNDEVVGLNYMQGDEYSLFLEHYNCIDKDLTKFYNAINYFDGETEIDRINEAIWAYVRYKDE